MDRKVKTVIIGMGRMGRLRYDALKRHGGFEIVAICDTRDSNLDGFAERKFHDWQECLESVELDAVIVCTYNAFIPEIVCSALKRGYHVFSEKPPGRNVADTLTMKAALESSGRILKFGFNHRYHNSIIEAKALVDSGLLGDIICARGVYGKAGTVNFESEWRNDAELSGGGILLDQGIHMLDLMHYFLGEFSSVKSVVDTLAWSGIQVEDNAFAIFETDRGQIASLHSSATQWHHRFNLDIVCTNGCVVLDGLITSTRSYGEERLTYYRKDLNAKTGKLGRPSEHTLCFTEDFSWDIEIKEFHDVLTGAKPLRNGTIDDALYVMQMIEQIYAAGRRGGN
ncbi:putative dehydrogenase [Paenibacillus cellulosilyticus]|uniref:Putative dehydrogenase n=1 Tax=Paenibacillus cellulosilyticus TaxID=375489 RepID=A0A2V2Z0F1_9BACL|nr:Gfo/Idh/MocA family oxidoreductase [Paenibacillus cellulosilyticus]PWW08327.1 putative dehydrogenase [Paenibacillus cellulosilyticus]QKS47926.1 Gfo/Idh/MocA family oxidoreductase [Paenibacillus cellulosilyticus]